MNNELTWYSAYEKVEPYVVKIITPQGHGTGFLFTMTGNKEILGIATAAHVIDFSHYWKQPIRIQRAKSGEIDFLENRDRVIDIDYDHDVASITIPNRRIFTFPDNVLPIIEPGKHKKVGVEIGWLGFPAIAPDFLCFFSGSVSAYSEKDRFYFVDGVAINGVSGGPTFSIDGGGVKMMGVVSAYIPNRATGAQLPGLCVVRDILPLHQTIKELKNFEDAKKREPPPEMPPPTLRTGS